MNTDSTHLYREHHAPLVRYLTRLTRCAQRAEDLAQGVWLRLLAARARGEPLPTELVALRSYLYTAARNLFIDEYKRKHACARTRTLDPTDFDELCGGDPDAASVPEHAVIQDERAALVRRALEVLPIEQRRVVTMWATGHSIAEMAQAASAPSDTVLSRKKYAFARLRLELQAVAAC